MKTILASAYAINPYKGSEDGMGWNFIYQIARFNKVIAITRENNKVHIEKFMNEKPDELYENITFLYFDLPYLLRFWKRGPLTAMFYFYLWQRMLPGFVKRKKVHFDIVHNVNFHNDWTPSHLWKLKKPFVWGPVGHHPLIPLDYLRAYETSYFFKDRLTWLIKKLFWNLSGDLKRTSKHADHVFCMNKSVPQLLQLKRNKYSITPSVATEDFGFDPGNKSSKFTLISAGRLVPLKGFDMTILSFSKFLEQRTLSEREKCELIIVGSGPELMTLQNIVKELHIEKYVTFIKWMNRNDLMNLFRRASVFVFPSHEGAGMVVAEALSFGLPIVCLDNCGPGEFIDKSCGIGVSYNNYNQTIHELNLAITKLYTTPDLLGKMSLNARKHFETHFNWNVRGNEFQKIYSNLN